MQQLKKKRICGSQRLKLDKKTPCYSQNNTSCVYWNMVHLEMDPNDISNMVALVAMLKFGSGFSVHFRDNIAAIIQAKHQLHRPCSFSWDVKNAKVINGLNIFQTGTHRFLRVLSRSNNTSAAVEPDSTIPDH